MVAANLNLNIRQTIRQNQGRLLIIFRVVIARFELISTYLANIYLPVRILVVGLKEGLLQLGQNLVRDGLQFVR